MRDDIVRALAKLSLIVWLAVMGAVFIGGTAAIAEPSDPAVAEQAAPSAAGLLEQAHPFGLVLAVMVVAIGVGVLFVAAFKPARRNTRDLAELLRD